MTHTTLPWALAATLCVAAAWGQTSPTATVAQPSSPAVVSSTSVATAQPPGERSPPPASVVVSGQPGGVVPAAAPAGDNQIVYSPQLPRVEDLTTAAASRGLTVERVVETATQVVVSYRDANGQPSMVTYQSQAPAVVAPATESAAVVVAPPPAVVYEQPPVVVYDDYPYSPRLRRPFGSVRVGIGHRSFHGGRHRSHRRH